MVAPPLPITSRILSGWILMVVMRGACSDICGRGSARTPFIFSRMCRRPSRACSSAACMISSVMPSTLMSICRALIPPLEPATLKSMSPRWSSSPMMSDSTTNLSSSLMRPMAMPATGAVMPMPASIRARLVPHTEAMELEPLDSVISETMRIT